MIPLDKSVEDRILIGGLTQTAPAGWSPVGWYCIGVEERTDGRTRARIWAPVDPPSRKDQP